MKTIPVMEKKKPLVWDWEGKTKRRPRMIRGSVVLSLAVCDRGRPKVRERLGARR